MIIHWLVNDHQTCSLCWFYSLVAAKTYHDGLWGSQEENLRVLGSSALLQCCIYLFFWPAFCDITRDMRTERYHGGQLAVATPWRAKSRNSFVILQKSGGKENDIVWSIWNQQVKIRLDVSTNQISVTECFLMSQNKAPPAIQMLNMFKLLTPQLMQWFKQLYETLLIFTLQ